MQIGIKRYLALQTVVLATMLAASHAARAQCVPQKPTELASICAIGWKYDKEKSTSDNFNPWPAHCENEDPQKRVLGDTSHAQVISRDACPGSITINKVIPIDHMAEVSCNQPNQSGGETFRVNLDSLQCNDSNSHTQADSRRLPLAATVCPPTENPEEVQFREFAESGPDPLLSAIQKKRYDKYKDEMIETQGHADADLQRLSRKYEEIVRLSSEDAYEKDAMQNELAEDLTHSLKELLGFQARAHLKYKDKCEFPLDPDSADIIRAQRSCRAIDAAVEKARYFLADGNASEMVSRVSSFFVSHGAGGDALAARTVFFYGHSEKERKDLLAKKEIYYVRDVPAGEIPGTPVIHLPGDGYVFGGDRLGAASGHGQDCSSFSVARDTIQGGLDSPPTSVLRNIAKMLQGDKSITPASLGAWAPFRRCFDVVDMRKGEKPRTLDLAVSVTDAPSHGHVTVIESYNAARGEIVDMEAKGGATGTITRCIRPLFEKPCGSAPDSNPGPGIDPPPVRPDLYVLRFKEPDDKSALGCPIHLK